MTEQSAGFRFDIYERVHLPEDRPAIGDLEQIELLPFVRGLLGSVFVGSGSGGCVCARVIG